MKAKTTNKNAIRKFLTETETIGNKQLNSVFSNSINTRFNKVSDLYFNSFPNRDFIQLKQ
ncbi:MAG TPA: hypothetical protein DER09_11440 [Prolixibacteraceae bacterium]|nr:hypothetical protein [Prolixibacteraceae bacterium]